jgi:hypothetical protein
MRKLALLAAAVPLLVGPPALAADKKTEHPSVCRAPEIDLEYDTATFTVVVTLPASGCKTREHTMFTLSAAISRVGDQDGRDLTERSATCGPFRSSDDFDNGEAQPEYSCNLAVFLSHPEVESAKYDVDVTYPAASGDEQTTSVFTFCTSYGQTATCEQ